MGLEGAELTRNSKAHMFMMPMMHTADNSYFTILSASV